MKWIWHRAVMLVSVAWGFIKWTSLSLFTHAKTLATWTTGARCTCGLSSGACSV